MLDEEFSKSFEEKRDRWVLGKNDLGAGRRLRKEGSQGPSKVVTARASDYTQARKFLGILWTMALYKKHKGKTPPGNKTGTYTYQGQAIKGILLPARRAIPQAPSRCMMSARPAST